MRARREKITKILKVLSGPGYLELLNLDERDLNMLYLEAIKHETIDRMQRANDMIMVMKLFHSGKRGFNSAKNEYKRFFYSNNYLLKEVESNH